MNVKKNSVFDWFLIGMVLAFLLAWIFPEPGATGGILQPHLLTNAGIMLVFFLHGLGLSFAAMKAGSLQWKLHLLVQLCVFGLFPALGFLLYFGLESALPTELRTGILFLSVLPSTVSSSVALTATAHGNVPAAVFNATLSSLLGVVMTPLLLGLVQVGNQEQGSQTGVILKLCLLLVCPLLVGQLLRPLLGNWAEKNKPLISVVDRLTILILVYTSFCDSFVLGVWSRYSVTAIVTTVGLSAGLFVVVFFCVSSLSAVLKLNRADCIAAIFCGSKKSLANGVPMAHLIFAGHPALGLIMMPVMVYHQLQLVICGVLASKWGNESLLEGIENTRAATLNASHISESSRIGSFSESSAESSGKLSDEVQR